VKKHISENNSDFDNGPPLFHSDGTLVGGGIFKDDRSGRRASHAEMQSQADWFKYSKSGILRTGKETWEDERREKDKSPDFGSWIFIGCTIIIAIVSFLAMLLKS